MSLLFRPGTVPTGVGWERESAWPIGHRSPASVWRVKIQEPSLEFLRLWIVTSLVLATRILVLRMLFGVP